MEVEGLRRCESRFSGLSHLWWWVRRMATNTFRSLFIIESGAPFPVSRDEFVPRSWSVTPNGGKHRMPGAVLSHSAYPLPSTHVKHDPMGTYWRKQIRPSKQYKMLWGTTRILPPGFVTVVTMRHHMYSYPTGQPEHSLR